MNNKRKMKKKKKLKKQTNKKENLGACSTKEPFPFLCLRRQGGAAPGIKV
jgi:hypothetical protein